MKFLQNAVGWLDGLYDFIGSRVRTDEVDLGAVQLVHDVGPNAVYSSGRERVMGGQNEPDNLPTATGRLGAGSFLDLFWLIAPADANPHFYQKSVSDFVTRAFTNYRPGAFDVWYVDTHLAPWPDATTEAAMVSLIQFPRGANGLSGAGGALAIPSWPEKGVGTSTGRWQRALKQIELSTATVDTIAGVIDSDSATSGYLANRKLHDGAILLDVERDLFQLYFQSSAGSVGDEHQFVFQLYITPRGVLPPLPVCSL